MVNPVSPVSTSMQHDPRRPHILANALAAQAMIKRKRSRDEKKRARQENQRPQTFADIMADAGLIGGDR
tara:strand:- start:280 stop:486 length:207 start_codon:yes stop_codon:yes gene_type:complete